MAEEENSKKEELFFEDVIKKTKTGVTFPKDFRDWQNIDLGDPFSQHCGMLAQENLPVIRIHNEYGHKCIIQNSDAEHSCRTMQLLLSMPNSSDADFSFNTTIGFYADINGTGKDVMKYALQQENSIQRAGMRLVADPDDKKIKIFYNDQEITRTNSYGLWTQAFLLQGIFSLSDFQWRVFCRCFTFSISERGFECPRLKKSIFKIICLIIKKSFHPPIDKLLLCEKHDRVESFGFNCINVVYSFHDTIHEFLTLIKLTSCENRFSFIL